MNDKTKNKVIYVLAFMFLMVLFHPLEIRASEFPDCMAIIYGLDDSENVQAYGNAVLFDNGSTSQVVAPGGSIWNSCSQFQVQMVAQGDFTEAVLLENNETAGIAVFSTNENVGGFTADMLRSVMNLSSGEKVYCCGLDFSIDSSSISELQKMEPYIAGEAVQADMGIFVELNEAFNSAMVGSMIIDANGQLLGFASAIDLNYFFAIDNFFDSSAGSSGGSGTGTNQPEENQPFYPSQSDGGQSAGFVNPLKSPYFLGMILIAIVVFVGNLIRYKNQEIRIQSSDRDEFADVGEVHAGVQGTGGTAVYTVQCLNGPIQGQTYQLSESSPLLFGRNPVCQVRYPSSTPGVSGTHCKLEVKGNQIILTDMNSSYGTFLNGQKLAPNVPYTLQSNAEFYLADRKNLFRIQ
ncbi:MAG: FHA domain-containing protein [Oliverpabstia sp.]